jgi:hypothetical protein
MALFQMGMLIADTIRWLPLTQTALSPFPAFWIELPTPAIGGSLQWRTGLWDPVRRASQSVKFLSSLPRNMEALGQEIKLGLAPKRSMSRYRELKYFQSTR